MCVMLEITMVVWYSYTSYTLFYFSLHWYSRFKKSYLGTASDSLCTWAYSLQTSDTL